MITKEGENPGKVGQGVPLSNRPKQKREGGLKALALRFDRLASGDVGAGLKRRSWQPGLPVGRSGLYGRCEEQL